MAAEEWELINTRNTDLTLLTGHVIVAKGSIMVDPQTVTRLKNEPWTAGLLQRGHLQLQAPALKKEVSRPEVAEMSSAEMYQRLKDAGYDNIPRLKEDRRMLLAGVLFEQPEDPVIMTEHDQVRDDLPDDAWE